MRMKRVEQRVNGMRGEENDGDERASFDFKNSRRKTIDRSSSNYRSGLAAANRRLLVILVVLILAFVTAAKWLENMEG